MFCHYCGREITEETAFCPYCGKEVTFTGAKEGRPSGNRRGKRKKWPWILLIVLLLSISAAITVTVLLPAVQKKNGAAISLTETEIQERTICYSNGDSVYSPATESIAFDEQYCAIYYNNLLTVYLSSDLSTEEAAALAETVDGIVVGDISGCMNVLQIMVGDTDLETLETYAERLMESDQVLYASYSFPIEMSEEEEVFWDGDSDLGNEWSPGGADWWAEAVGAYTAWDYSSLATPMTVGIMDNGFFINHEDLLDSSGNSVITMLNENSINSNDNSPQHGTHVAGLVAAQNNAFGMRGIADTAKLVCIDWKKADGTSLLYPAAVIENIKQMVEHASAAGTPIVINCSWGASLGFADWIMSISRPKSTQTTQQTRMEQYCLQTSVCAIQIIEQLLLNGEEDFLIVQSAGNGYENGGWGYKASLSGWFCSITQSLCNHFSGFFTYDTIKSHIIIVGAVQNAAESGRYKLTSFSNYGSTLDICAPGYDIYSTVLDNQYGYRDGTSMAAPIVAGSAALVWSINPDLTASGVKEMLIQFAGEAVGITGEDKGTVYPMLNTGRAVEQTIGTTTCSVGDLETGLEIPYAAVTLSNEAKTYEIETNEIGSFSKTLYPGTYTMTTRAENYRDDVREVTITLGENASLGTVMLEKAEDSIDIDTEHAVMKPIGYQNHKYCLYVIDGISWEDAKAYCERMGGHLVTITSQGEQHVLQQYIQEYGMDTDIWIGITDANEEGNWSEWITGEKVVFSNWGENEPDNHEGEQNYGVICNGSREGSTFRISSGEWDDVSDNEGAFICEWDMGDDDPTGQDNAKARYLDELSIIECGQYDGNMGDSFVYKIGAHQFTRGNTNIEGKSYRHGIEVWLARWDDEEEVSWAYSVFDLGKRYTSLTGKCVLIDSYNATDFDVTLEYCGDGKVIAEYHLTPESIPFSIDIDISGISELKIYAYDNTAVKGGTSFGLVEMALDADSDGEEDNVPASTATERLNEEKYKFYELDSVTTWTEAEAYCAEQGGHLAIISSKEENDFLYALMIAQGYSSAYFGITDSETEGTWVWVDGSPAGYTNWHEGEPNSENSNEDYGMFYYKYEDGSWNDGDFGDRTVNGGRVFICEWD